MKKMNHLIALVLACFSGAAAAAAADFPSKPVTIVVPFSPGGSSDSITRIVAKELSRKWKQPVLVENRSGGKTVIATEYVVKAKADGYTILYNSFAWITNQLLIKELPYKPTDLAPVTLLGRYPLALFVQGGLPVSNLAEFIEYAKKKNQPLTFGNAGVGSSMHLAALEFSSLTGLKIMSVPYKGSIAALNDVMGKQIDAIFEGEVYRPHTETGRVKALFVGQPERMSGWALPSATEAGLPKFNMSSWFGLMVPSETPIAIREKLATDVTAVLRQPDVRERLRVLGLLSAGMTSAEYGTYLESESVKLGAFVERNRADLQ